MRIARVTHAGSFSYARLDDGGTAHLYDTAPWGGGRETGATAREYGVDVPVEPSKIVCVGRNYAAHARELGHDLPELPLLFLKPPSALMAHEGVIEHPPESQRGDFEGEIAVVIGSRGRHVGAAEAHRHIFGITCANDVTARDLQMADVQFTRGKGFDTFCPCGPWIETDFGDLNALTVRTRVDGSERQLGRADRMLWGIPALLEYISGIMTLEPGDLILTGTPEGVGPLTANEVVEVEVGTVGVLRSTMGGSSGP